MKTFPVVPLVRRPFDVATSNLRFQPAVERPRFLLVNTTRWACTARMAIGLAVHGDVFAVCPDHHPILKTRAARKVFPYSGLRPLRSLVAAIDATRPDIVLPADDRATLHLHSLYAQAIRLGAQGRPLAELLIRSLGSPQSHAIVSARYKFLNVARELKIRVPEMMSVQSCADLAVWQKSQPFPWVLKADGTSGGRGVAVVHTSQSARVSLERIQKMFGAARAFKRWCVNRDRFWVEPWWNRVQPSIIVQSFIQGRPANCAVVCWEGKVLAGYAVDVLVADGDTGPASIVRVVDSPVMMGAAEKIARALGLSGFFGLDFMIEEKTGEIYLIEINPRSTPLCHLQLGPGRDMVAALCTQLAGFPVPATPPITDRDVIAYFPRQPGPECGIFQSSYYDIPLGEPELTEELMHPWPDRTLLFKCFSKRSEVPA